MSHPLRFASFASELWLRLCCSVSGYSRTCREACGGGVFWSPFGPNLRFETVSTQHGTARNGVFFFWPIEDGQQQTSQSGGALEKKQKEEELGSTVLWETQSELNVFLSWVCWAADTGKWSFTELLWGLQKEASIPYSQSLGFSTSQLISDSCAWVHRGD